MRTSSLLPSRLASRLASLLASLALAAGAIAPVFGAACGSTSDTSPSGDGGGDGAISEDAGTEDASYLVDAAVGARCTMQNLSDPVGLCVQKAALLGEHAEFSAVTGLPSTWSVDTLLATTTDAGAPVHDVRDDIGYGASLADYYASATAYGDSDQIATITGDMDAVAQLLQTELATLPADYDGAIYTRLRRLAAGLRLAGFGTDGDAIDAIAVKYGRAIYTNYFHALTGVEVTPDAGADAGAGADDGGADDGGLSDDAATTEDASINDASSGDATTSDAGVADAGPGLQGDGILGTAASSGYAYDAAKAASGALALVDMAARANGFTLTPDGGADAAAPDPTDALTWSRAAAAVLNHLASRARDTSGLYFNTLQTSSAPGHDTVTDDGSFATLTQGSIALSYVRAARLATLGGLGALPAQALTSDAVSILGAVQSTTPSLWDPLFNNLALAACNAAIPTVVPCGDGFFSGFDPTKTVLDERKGISANALLLDALHRANLIATLTTAEGNDVAPLLGLFAFRNPDEFGEDAGVTDGFFTQVVGQSAFVSYVTQTFALTETEDGGLPELEDGAVFGGASVSPLARAYSAAATADAIEGMSDQWLGLTGAPTFFQ